MNFQSDAARNKSNTAGSESNQPNFNILHDHGGYAAPPTYDNQDNSQSSKQPFRTQPINNGPEIQNYTWHPPAAPNEPCSNALYKRQCNPQCPLKYDLDWVRLNKGICFHEFKEQNSCRRKDQCWFSHEIPANLRTDIDFCKYMKRLKKTKLSKKSTVQQRASPCPRAFLMVLKRVVPRVAAPTITT